MNGIATGYDLAEFRRQQSLTQREMLARLGVIIAATLGVWLGLGLTAVLIWTLSYILWLAGYAFVLARLPERVTRWQLVLVLLAEAGATLHWPVLYAYLWVQGQATTWLLCALIVAAAMTNAMGARCEEPILRWSDRLGVLLLLAATVALFVWQGHTVVQVAIVVIVSLLMFYWLEVSVADVATVRGRLARAEREVLERQRIEAMGRLTGGVAHDFNNILTVIGGNLDLMREVSDPSEKLALLAEARSATGRAAAVTAQLLAYSRQSVLSPRPTDIGDCLCRVEAFMTRLLPTSVRLTCHLAPDLPMIDIDPTRLESTMINLILNGRDAMPDGGAVMVSAKVMPGQPRVPAQVVIAVADTGTGIDPAVLPRVAEPYFTTKPPGKGSGLGLSMVKGFAEQSGGHLNIRSVPGHGTVVEMVLPERPEAQTNQSVPARWSSTMASIRSSGT